MQFLIPFVNYILVNLTCQIKYGSALALLRRTQRPLHGVKADASRLRLLGEGLTAPRKLSTIKKRPEGAFVLLRGLLWGKPYWINKSTIYISNLPI
jgi:hypothetical protein